VNCLICGQRATTLDNRRVEEGLRKLVIECETPSCGSRREIWVVDKGQAQKGYIADRPIVKAKLP
jgi:hypothetical protein